jgi:hypothetical protein
MNAIRIWINWLTKRTKKSKQFLFLFTKTTKRNIFFWFIGQIYSACSLELSAAYFHPASSVFFSQQISQQYFQPLIFSPSEEADCIEKSGKGEE